MLACNFKSAFDPSHSILSFRLLTRPWQKGIGFAQVPRRVWMIWERPR